MHRKIAFIPALLIFVLLVPYILKAADKTPEELLRQARDQVREVSIQEAKEMIDSGSNVVILDIRDKEEFEREHIPDAINISRGMLEFLVRAKIPDKETKIIVY